MARRRPAFPWTTLLLSAALFLLIGGWLLGRLVDERLSKLALGGLGESFPTLLWSAPLEVSAAGPAPGAVLARLEALRYRKAAGTPQPGEYRWQPPLLELHARGFSTPAAFQEPAAFRLAWTRKGWDIEGLPEGAAFRLEPVLFAEISGSKRIRREPATFQDFPKALIDAVVAAEDKRFFTHPGLDPVALVRAAWSNVSNRGGVQGGSTITQQIAKNYFLSPERTLRRKVSEALLALYLERRYSKQDLLVLYLNHIYLGQDGPVAVMGAKAAARHYFARPLAELTPGQAALLAGLIRAPATHNPFAAPEEARARRNRILGRMRGMGRLEETAYHAALLEPLPQRPAAASAPRDAAAWFTAAVTRELESRFEGPALRAQGLSVHTTLLPELQEQAQAALAGCRPQCALVALDPESGDVRALVGGRDFRESQYDRAVLAKRQPGSAFKPFVYAAAVESGVTAAQVLLDAPTRYVLHDGPWVPRNYEGVYRGTATVREALALSLNGATLDLARRVGMPRIVSLAGRFGLETPRMNPAVVLGAYEASLLPITAAYAPFANGGRKVRPRLIAAVLDSEGAVVESGPPETRRVLDPAVAALARSLLETAVDRGTGRGLRRLGFSRAAAAKTGTTNEGRDAWFIGFTPELLAGVWVGDDRSTVRGLSGAKDALPLWGAFMDRAVGGLPAREFPQAAGLVRARVDPASGGRAVAGCPAPIEELFLQDTEPAKDCPLHRKGVVGWFQRLFSR